MPCLPFHKLILISKHRAYVGEAFCIYSTCNLKVVLFSYLWKGLRVGDLARVGRL